MRGKHETAIAGTAAASEVANAELSCYGVFRKLEPDDEGRGEGVGGGGGGGGDVVVVVDGRVVCGGGGGGECVIAGRRPPPRLSVPPPPGTAFSPQEPAFAHVTAAADDDRDHDHDHDHDYEREHEHRDCCDGYYDDGDFDRGTYSVYNDCYCCDAAIGTDAPSTATTTTTGPASAADHRGCCCPRGDELSDFGPVVWDCDCDCSAATADTTITGDLRGVGGAAAAPFSHTPMGSTTKLVGIDANSDDTPKVRICVPYTAAQRVM